MTPRAVTELVVRMAGENPTWGYTQIRGALANLGHNIARNTVKRILHDHGLDPAPERNQRTPWKTFLQTHWEGLAAADLFTVEVLTLAGRKPVFVQAFVAEAPVEGLDVGVLVRLAGFNETQGQPLRVRPCEHRATAELLSVVQDM